MLSCPWCLCDQSTTMLLKKTGMIVTLNIRTDHGWWIETITRIPYTLYYPSQRTTTRRYFIFCRGQRDLRVTVSVGWLVVRLVTLLLLVCKRHLLPLPNRPRQRLPCIEALFPPFIHVFLPSFLSGSLNSWSFSRAKESVPSMTSVLPWRNLILIYWPRFCWTRAPRPISPLLRRLLTMPPPPSPCLPWRMPSGWDG